MAINLDLVQLSLEENRFAEFNDWREIEEGLTGYIESSEPGASYLDLWLDLLAQVLLRQGRLKEARQLYQKLCQDCFVQVSSETELYIKGKEAELALAEERWSEAIQCRQWMIDYHARHEYQWLQARSMLDLAEAYLNRNELGDAQQARHFFRQAADMFTEMGAEVYAEIAQTRLASINHM